MVKCWIDGCCEPINPGGTAAYGVVVVTGDETIRKSGVIGFGDSISNSLELTFIGSDERKIPKQTP